MNKNVLYFFAKLFFLTLLVLLSNWGIRAIIANKSYWGFEELETKRHVFDQKIKTYNNLFIGSSRFYRQIDPITFDKNIDSSFGLQSFNYGLHSLSPPQVYDVYEEILAKDSLQLKYAFLELMNVPQVAIVNLTSDRVIYWYNWQSYWFAVKAISQSNRTIVRKIYGIFSHTFCYFEYLLNFKMWSKVNQLKTKQESGNADLEIAGKNLNGFYSYDEEMNTRNKANFDYKGMLKGYNDFMNDTSSVSDYKAYSQLAFSSSIDTINYNKIHLHKIQQLIEKSKQKDIHLIVFLPPRLVVEDYEELIPIFAQIPKDHRIEISNSHLYPELYLAKYTFDFGHLNEVGAQIFSKKIAQEFNKLQH
ncbi:MAG: hypothetical protein EAZ07_00240 [Cytophagales bacterium]|nr:MAG: hypothetical protein EAZ07_00240 [Cytophagales bacterium]